MKNIMIVFMVLCTITLSAQRKNKKKAKESVPMIVEKFSYNTDSLKHGPYVYYYKENLRMKGNYNNGKKDGQWLFYANDNKLMIDASYKDDVFDGDFVLYKNGNPTFKCTYKDGELEGKAISNYLSGKTRTEFNYKKGKLYGEYIVYYESGQVKIRTEYFSGIKQGFEKNYYINGQLLSDVQYWFGNPINLFDCSNKNGTKLDCGDVKNGTGIYREYRFNENDEIFLSNSITMVDSLKSGKFTDYSIENEILSEGFYNKDFKTGIWKHKSEEEYKLVNMDTVVNDNKVGYEDIDFFTIVEEMPAFETDGENCLVIDDRKLRKQCTEYGLQRYIGTIKYPIYARENDIEGVVYIRFIVSKTGMVDEAKIVRGAHEVLNNAATKHILLMPNWLPGMQRGQPVKVQYVIPIRFKLN